MRFTLFILFLSFLVQGKCQELAPNYSPESFLKEYKSNILDKNKFVWGFNFGLAFEIGEKRDGGLRLFTGIAVAKKVSNYLVPSGKVPFWELLAGFQSELEVYRGGVGTSFFKSERSKIWIDWRNAPLFSLGRDWRTSKNKFFNKRLSGRPLHPSIGHGMGVLPDPTHSALTFGSIFITGINHPRNQQLGYLMFGYQNFQIYYINDGPPYDKLRLGDEYDRWWTGSGQIGYYFMNDRGLFTDILFRYDKFTGYQELLYETGYNLQIHNLPYKKIRKQYFNQGRYQLKLGIKNTTHFNLSIFNPAAFDVQDIIHLRLGMPFHATLNDEHKTIGFDTRFSQFQNF